MFESLYFWICLVIVWYLFVNQFATLWILKFALAFLSSHFPTWPKKLWQTCKNVNILRMKRAFKMKWKALFIIFKGFSLNQTPPNFLECYSPTFKSSYHQIPSLVEDKKLLDLKLIVNFINKVGLSSSKKIVLFSWMKAL